jgi:hypothetical protein
MACTACACLVKADEASCPFCGATVLGSPRRLPQRRTSRGAWLAFGPVTFVGAVATGATCAVVTAACNGQTVADKFVVEPEASVPSTPVDTSMVTADASVPEPEAGEDAARALPCGDLTCAWPATYCSEYQMADCRYMCGQDPGGCQPPQSTFGCHPASVPPQCASAPTCACVADAGGPFDTVGGAQSVSCSNGGLYVKNTVTLTGCGGCYGCPPARLERLVA